MTIVPIKAKPDTIVGALPEVPAGYIQTASGHGVDLLNPRVEDVNWNDIAISLAMQCRYTGHMRDTSSFLSIAQHSVMVADLLPDAISIYGLLHDCHEAYFGDDATPKKRALASVHPEAARWLEEQKAAWDAVIWQAACVPPPDAATQRAVHQADYQALAVEHNSLQAGPADALTRAAWVGLPDMKKYGVASLPSQAAHDLFLVRLNELMWTDKKAGTA